MKAGATTPAQYLASLPADRRAAMTTLHRAIVKAAPSLKPVILYGMIGYGKMHYKYPSGREGDACIVALASQKAHLSLYLCAVEGKKYLAEQHARELGKVSVGKSCIRFKRLEDLNLKLALSLIKRASALLKQNDGSWVLK